MEASSLRHGQEKLEFLLFTEVIPEEVAAALWRRELDDARPPSLMQLLTGRRLFY
jgi:hypothetical protein